MLGRLTDFLGEIQHRAHAHQSGDERTLTPGGCIAQQPHPAMDGPNRRFGYGDPDLGPH
jgi:hypothetical protein